MKTLAKFVWAAVALAFLINLVAWGLSFFGLPEPQVKSLGTIIFQLAFGLSGIIPARSLARDEKLVNYLKSIID